MLERLIDAWRADDRQQVDAWTAWLAACRPTRETRAEERQLGAGLSRALGAIGVTDAAGWEAREDVTQAAMFALSDRALRDTDVRGAGRVRVRVGRGDDQRGGPAGPARTERGQRLLAAAGDEFPAAVERARALDDDELAATAPGQAIASALHEALYSRLFRS